MFQNPSNEKLKDILQSAKSIAVVGLSNNKSRDSYAVAEELQKLGYRIIPVNPNLTEVLGEKCYPSISDIAEPVDIIDVFRKSDALPDVVREAAKTSTPVIWAQLGVYNEEAARIAEAANKTLVMDLCIKVMHRRLI
ncbi:CoA-binding protein [Alicyclobacillus ferrooxydans]|uniref:CoA-binding protein n=1 Tax=Alicyclobacillus ferrooxydans TaxID=471514 RepID=A0A0P9GVJ5_9BACL|nr:CoA-binding protein [Alicyclobacillus ferrooxydans]KPV45288.1 CoA-binding protein [Alicyclobacillus ferrooxydans]